MADDAVALTQQLNTLTESLDSVMDKMKEMLRLFGRIDARGGAALRGLNTQSRNLNDNFRQIVERLGKMSTPATTVGAAATSQALGTLTGMGGGAMRGLSAFRDTRGKSGNKFIDSLLSPLALGLPNVVGTIASIVPKLAGWHIKTRGGAGGGLFTGMGEIAGAVAAAGTSLALGAGTSYAKQAFQQHHALELAGRRLHEGIYGGMFPGKTRKDPGRYAGQQFGYTRGQAAALFGAIQGGTAGIGVGIGDQGYLGRLAMSASLRGQFRTDPGALLGVAGTLAAGGHRPGEMTGRIMGTMAAQGFRGRADTERLTVEYLSGIQGLLQQQVNSRGLLGRGDEARAYGLMRALSTGPGGGGLFDPSVAKGVAQGLMGGVMAPGGGASGQIAMLQAMGFGNPNMEGLNAASRAMGGPGNFQRTSYLQAMKMMENPLQNIDRLLASVRFMAGTNVEYQGAILNAYTGLGLTKSDAVMANAGNIHVALRTALEEQRLAPSRLGKEDALDLLTAKLERYTSTLLGGDKAKAGLVDLANTMTGLHESMGKLVLNSLPTLVTAVKGTGGLLTESIDNLTWALNKWVGESEEPQKKKGVRRLMQGTRN